MRRNKKCNRCGGIVFITKYRHYRTGKLMIASDYGYRAWPLPCTCDTARG